MGRNDLAIRFTENKYATKSEVSKELKMSLIDSIWSDILSYRSGFNRYLSIKSIEKNQLVVCFCPSVTSLSNSTDMKLIRLMKEYAAINRGNGDINRFEDECMVRSLRALAKEHDLEASDQYLRSLIHGDIREVSPSMTVLVRYLEALKYVRRAYVNAIDVDFIAELYSRLLGTNELTSFYRTTEDTNRENRVLIDRVYTCAPTLLIEGMMDNLFSFLSTSTLSAASKASIAYYYINYIRPFSVFSDEVALLTAKAILAHGDLGEIGVLLPLESLLSDNQEEIARIFVEVQKTSDVTYFLNFAMKQIERHCDELLDLSVSLKTETLKKDFYRTDEVKQPQQAVSYTYEQPSLFDNVEPQTQQQVQQPQPQPQPIPQPSPRPEPVVEQPKEEIKEPEQPKVEPQVKVVEPVKEEPVHEVVQEQIAVAYIPPAIDEKQALRLEQHLLELDPSLRKHEARFYARHCTLGKSYTIAQYKRMIGCVYETARTAMDHLVELGYYRKDSSNKKFIYTPIPRK